MSTVDTYRDGGTVCVEEGEKCFCIDFRIDTQTKGSLYDDYPNRGSIVYKQEDFLKFLEMVGNLDEDKGISRNEFEAIWMMVDRIKTFFR